MNDMSVQELRQSLREKGLNCRGSRKQLVQRLVEAHELSSANPSPDPPIKYRVTLFCLGSNAATMLLLAPAPGAKMLSQILQRASNKFRIRAKRVFVAGSGVECSAETMEGLVRDGVKMVVSSGGKYEMQTATGSPTIVGLTGGDSPVQGSVVGTEEEEDDGSVHASSAVEEVGDELKMDALDISSEAGSTTLSLDDGKSDEGDGRVLFTPTHTPITTQSLLSSLSSTLASSPSWLPSSKPVSSSAFPSSSPMSSSSSIPIPSRATPSSGKDEKYRLSPSPSSSSSSSSSSPSLTSSSPLPPSHISSLYSSISTSSPSPTSSSPPLDNDPHSLLLENARLREQLRSYDDKRRHFRKMEIALKASQAQADAAVSSVERVKELEVQVKEWQERYADSEMRCSLQMKANEKAVREKEGLKAKHASVVDKLTKAQSIKAELDSLHKTHRETVSELAEFRGKNVEEKSLVQLQAILEFHQQMVVRLHSVIVARMDSERKVLQEKWICRLCYEKDINVVMQPCGHAVACSRCSALVDCCPVCRRVISHRQTLHLG